MRVLVCGGRDYQDSRRVYAVLDKLHSEVGIDRLIEGGARGADRLAQQWAEQAGVPVSTYEADWGAFGAFAGHKRNTTMLEDGQPDLVIAFPGGKGTRNMMRQARRTGVEVVEISHG